MLLLHHCVSIFIPKKLNRIEAKMHYIFQTFKVGLIGRGVVDLAFKFFRKY